MHLFFRHQLVFLSAVSLVVLAGCSGDSSSSGATVPPTATVTTSADIIQSEGKPRLFSVECSRLALDANTGNWEPQAGFVRVETWVYPNAAGSEVVSIANGEVIDSALTADDYSAYLAPDIDPRLFGCGEPIATVERVLNGTELLTTAGGPDEAALNLGAVQLKLVYYTINGAASGVQVTYSNDLMIGMVSL
ncbi:MAG: hypothetical protein GY792_06615 [Gammaproteobacteria bacterium]|nr:hypothetical protein [Gammaproteobacteria bacterium]